MISSLVDACIHSFLTLTHVFIYSSRVRIHSFIHSFMPHAFFRSLGDGRLLSERFHFVSEQELDDHRRLRRVCGSPCGLGRLCLFGQYAEER